MFVVKLYSVTLPLLVADLITSELHISMKFLKLWSQEMKDVVSLWCCMVPIKSLFVHLFTYGAIRELLHSYLSDYTLEELDASLSTTQ